MQEESQKDYLTGICKVQDYIDHHIEEVITVEDLSKVSGFSKYHFSRIFQNIRKEALMHYTNRIRVERAKFYLAYRLDKNITQIAFLLGFRDASVFSRAFKTYSKISPKDYRKRYSKNCNETYLLSEYNKKAAKTEGKMKKSMVETNVTIEYLAEKQLIYVRHTYLSNLGGQIRRNGGSFARRGKQAASMEERHLGFSNLS